MFESVGQTDRAGSVGERLAEWFKRWAADLAVISVAGVVLAGGIVGLIVLPG
jgi:hypothetical protein